MRIAIIFLMLSAIGCAALAEMPRRAFMDMTKAADRAFDPTHIPGCILWLDGQDAATITMSASNTVSVWADKSGAGNHATNGAATSQPVWTNSGIAGHAALNFTSDLLFMGGGVRTTNATVVAVFRRASKNIISLPVGGSSGGVGPYPLYWASDNIPYVAMASGYRSAASDTNAGNYVSITYIPGSVETSSVLRLNKSSKTLGVVSGASGSRAYQIGGRANNYHSGMIGEVIVYSSGSLTIAEITNLENYVNTKWSLGL